MVKAFLTGNEIIVKAAQIAGAKIFFGYPITPSTEILHSWSEEVIKNSQLKILQTEDEIAASFGVVGAVLAGEKAFTATAGPGTVLIQDAVSMAEAMRLPFVGIIMQRGGPSTGTVIYSQQEVILTCYGGNGEGLRIVYSPSSLEELYFYTIVAFNSAWRYRFPTFVLSDGYLAKMKGSVSFYSPPSITKTRSVLGKKSERVNLRNTYSFEEELYQVLRENILDFKLISPKIEAYESYQTKGAEIILVSHGSVGSSAKEAVKFLRRKGRKIGLFRPITLRPFPSKQALRILSRAREVIIFESSQGQLARILKDEVYHLGNFKEYYTPGLGISPEDIIKEIE